MSPRRTPSLKSQGGQLITEAILIIVLLFGMTYLVANQFKNQELLKQLITGPWQSLAGMLQNGIWAPPKTGAVVHPNGHVRHMALAGEDAK